MTCETIITYIVLQYISALCVSNLYDAMVGKGFRSVDWLWITDIADLYWTRINQLLRYYMYMYSVKKGNGTRTW